MKNYKWQIQDYEHLKVDVSGVIYNTKTNRIKKLCLNGYSRGIWVTKTKFLTNPNEYLVLNKTPGPVNDFERQLLAHKNNNLLKKRKSYVY